MAAARARKAEFDLAVEAMLEAFPAGVVIFDREGRPVYANGESMRIVGIKSLEETIELMSGRLPVVVVPLEGSGAPCTTDKVQRVLAGESLTDDLERVTPLDGRPNVILRASFRPIVEDGVITGVLKMIVDVTNEYELTRRKNEFLCVTTHELRTPATILRLTAHTLLARASTEPELRKAATIVDRTTRRIEVLSSKLMDIASLASGNGLALQRSLVRLDGLAEEAISSLESAQASRVRLTRTEAPVWADATRMREVVDALVDNALRYSDASSSVEVDVTANDGTVEFAVTDHGVGIPANKQAHMLEPFFRAHTNTPFDRGGLGASLYLAAEIMKQHGGRLWFESRERVGSTFHVNIENGEEHVAVR